MSEFKNTEVIQFEDILAEASKYEELATHTLSNGKDMEFYPYFATSKIKEVIEEYVALLNSTNKDDKKVIESITKDETSIIYFWYFLTIKKFTHFGVQMKKAKTLRALLPYYNALYETGLFEEIINDVFLFEELKKINNMFATETATKSAAFEFLNKHEEELEKAREKFSKQLENE